MPSVAQEEPLLHPSKKRRRHDNDDAGPEPVEGSVQLYDAVASSKRPGYPQPEHILIRSNGQVFHHHHNHNHHHHGGSPLLEASSRTDSPASLLLTRKIAPSPIPIPKRIRVEDEEDSGAWRSHQGGGGVGVQQRRMAVPRQQQQQQKTSTVSTAAREAHEAEKQEALRLTSANSPRPYPSTAKLPSGGAASALAPCHICSRRPTKKTDLVDYSDCEGCGQRACYICFRECLGWWDDESGGGVGLDHDTESEDVPVLSQMMMDELEEDGTLLRPLEEDPRGGLSSAVTPTSAAIPVWSRGGASGHRQKICSRCCVEHGANGDVICLGCLQRR